VFYVKHFCPLGQTLVGEYGSAHLFAPALDIQHGFAVVKEHGLLDSQSISAIDLLPLRGKHFRFLIHSSRTLEPVGAPVRQIHFASSKSSHVCDGNDQRPSQDPLELHGMHS
jgi:hypothetical protein